MWEAQVPFVACEESSCRSCSFKWTRVACCNLFQKRGRNGLLKSQLLLKGDVLTLQNKCWMKNVHSSSDICRQPYVWLHLSRVNLFKLNAEVSLNLKLKANLWFLHNVCWRQKCYLRIILGGKQKLMPHSRVDLDCITGHRWFSLNLRKAHLPVSW